MNSRIIDLKGQRIGAWKVLSFAGPNSYGQSTWLCRCRCGTERKVNAQTLREKLTSSCGCLKGAAIALFRTKHGHSRGGESRTYVIWGGMHNRCRNETHVGWKYYGGRGIKVCDRWNDFQNFLEDMGEAPKSRSLDRFPNMDGDYEKSNCRWATTTQQANNRRKRGTCVAQPS